MAISRPCIQSSLFKRVTRSKHWSTVNLPPQVVTQPSASIIDWRPAAGDAMDLEGSLRQKVLSQDHQSRFAGREKSSIHFYGARNRISQWRPCGLGITAIIRAGTGQPPAPPATLTLLPPPGPTCTPFAPPPPTIAPAGCDKAAFVADVTVPDGTLFTAGTTFIKTWRLKNSAPAHGRLLINCSSTTANKWAHPPRSMYRGASRREQLLT